MNARIAELEDLAEQARLRAAKLEKEKNKLTVEIRELTIELETVSIIMVTDRCYSKRLSRSKTLIVPMKTFH